MNPWIIAYIVGAILAYIGFVVYNEIDRTMAGNALTIFAGLAVAVLWPLFVLLYGAYWIVALPTRAIMKILNR